MAKVLITNTCHVRRRLMRKGATVELADDEAASVVASGCGKLMTPTPAETTATAAVVVPRTAVKLGG
ncbi:hypothetical protein [Paludisphaera rhizosphaerae]|uniref:hypothetical protein n=1 Tax=Paludisphaera rhizosphaerae TaxID=2711216 RepID=UPI0013EC51CF|nr:hypothetical protein [Paludisphaera rhizosphaerae]